MIEFKDGESMDITGELRIERNEDGYAVLGDGILMQFENEEDAKTYLFDIESKNIFCYYKMFRSPNIRKRVKEAERSTENHE